jgi:two-component system response regulator RegA
MENRRRVRSVSTVLVVDDEAAFLRSMIRELSRRGVRAQAAEDADQAIASASAMRFDLAIVDLWVPGAEGIDICRRIKELDSSTFTIMLSGYLPKDLVFQAGKSNAVDHFAEKDDFSVEGLLYRAEYHAPLPVGAREHTTLHEARTNCIERALFESDYNVTRAAERLGILRQSLQRMQRKRVGKI